jgi:CheY-like chemotaxis protein
MMRGSDELVDLGDQFNSMASRLERSYATMEREVAQRTRELSEANHAKSRFLAAASHDLRQPLHALNLLVGQLDQPATNAQRHILTKHIGQAVASINSLFDDLLDISRLEAGVVRTDVSDIPLHEVIERVVAAALPDAQEKGLCLRILIGDVWVTSDAVLLQRILSNLVGNAVRYTERGGVLVGCRIRGEHVSVEVWDTGIGILPERHKDIFSEFYQIADPQIARRGEGLGLGLSIVARLTRLLDHDVSVCSLPGRGSRFAIRVKLGTQDNATSARFGESEPSLPVDSLQGLLLLLIDNDANILYGAKSLLIQWGCQVVTARSRTEAFEDLEDRAPSLVIADFRLDNGDDGVSVIHAIREKFGPVPALIVTGEISVSTRQRVSAAGLHMLEKPVPPLRLRTALTRLARGQRRSPEMSNPGE